MIEHLLNVFLRKKVTPVTLEEGFKTVSLWTAGIKFESRLNNVLNCKVHEPVHLVREPKNKIDSNAIHVKRLNGQSLGYVGKFKAEILASLLDEAKMDSRAFIIDVKCDLLKDIYGVKIAFNIKSEYADLFDHDYEVIDVLFDKSPKGNLYLLLSCEESVLDSVKDLFKKNSISIYRSGVSYRAAKNGKNYDWYFFLDQDTNEVLIQQLLEARFPILKEKSTLEFNEEYLMMQEEELDELKKSSSDLIFENTTLKNNLEKSNRLLSQLDNQFEKFINAIFPEVEFLEPSLDVLQTGILDFSKALNEIKKIVSDTDYKGKPIKTVDGWFDTHFSTGVRNDGRIYFKKNNRTITMLVSLKGEQTSDIKRLSKYK